MGRLAVPDSAPAHSSLSPRHCPQKPQMTRRKEETVFIRHVLCSQSKKPQHPKAAEEEVERKWPENILSFAESLRKVLRSVRS